MKEGAKRTSRKAIISMFFGVIGLLLVWINLGIVIAAVLSLIFGRRAMREIKKDPNLKGKAYVFVGGLTAAITIAIVIIAEISGTDFVF